MSIEFMVFGFGVGCNVSSVWLDCRTLSSTPWAPSGMPKVPTTRQRLSSRRGLHRVPYEL